MRTFLQGCGGEAARIRGQMTPAAALLQPTPCFGQAIFPAIRTGCLKTPSVSTTRAAVPLQLKGPRHSRRASCAPARFFCRNTLAADLRIDLPSWPKHYTTPENASRTTVLRQTPMPMLLDGKSLWREKAGQPNSSDREIHQGRRAVRSSPDYSPSVLRICR